MFNSGIYYSCKNRALLLIPLHNNKKLHLKWITWMKFNFRKIHWKCEIKGKSFNLIKIYLFKRKQVIHNGGIFLVLFMSVPLNRNQLQSENNPNIQIVYREKYLVERNILLICFRKIMTQNCWFYKKKYI